MLTETALAIRERFAHDTHRPVYHFLPPSNWMNDPNGFIHWNSKYHLFYQHNPSGALWGNIHWGHTVSDDLIHWTDLPIALSPTPGGPDEAGCFSGCAVNNNGVPTFIYTGTRGQHHEIQTQCVAISDDGLFTWKKHRANPVLADIPAESHQTRDFRDPYVWKEADAWYMVIGSRIQDVGGAVFLYRSADLLNWEYLHPLLTGDKQRNGVIWECPNFFKLGNEWVLIVSAHMGNATDTVLYWVGSFEDHQFKPVYEGVLDYGQYYAPLSIGDAQDRRIIIAWLREARSPQQQEKAGWSGVQSIPRVLTLDNHRLLMKPVSTLESVRSKHHQYTSADLLDNGFLDVEGQSLDIDAVFTHDATSEYGLSLCGSAQGPECFEVIYYPLENRLAVHIIAAKADISMSHAELRRSIGQQFGFAEETSSIDSNFVKLTQSIPHTLFNGEKLQLRILLDGSVAEIIANERTSFTCRIYPSTTAQNKVRHIGNRNSIDIINIWEMSSIWQSSQS